MSTHQQARRQIVRDVHILENLKVSNTTWIGLSGRIGTAMQLRSEKAVVLGKGVPRPGEGWSMTYEHQLQPKQPICQTSA